jgi:capsular exopolysaccharide synthesis family protein
VGVALAFLRDHLDDRIKSKEDLERSGATVPVLGLIPRVSGWRDPTEAEIVSLMHPNSGESEAYRTLRNSIQFHRLEHDLQTLQVTSPSTAEGKSTTVANLGVSLARAGQRVVIVDCDLRRPRIHEFFGMSNETGFTSVLLGDIGLTEALVGIPHLGSLAVLQSGAVPPDPSELLVSQRAADIFRALKEQADVMLVDSPPVLPVSDATALSARMDALLMVVTPGKTTRKQVARSVELLDQVKAPLFGTVLNGVSAQGRYGYGYAYAYRGYASDGDGSATRQSTPSQRSVEGAPVLWTERS